VKTKNIVIPVVLIGIIALGSFSTLVSATDEAEALIDAPVCVHGGTIDASGHYVLNAEPDKVDIALGVEVQANSAADAQRSAANTMDNIRTRMSLIGIAKSDISTASYYVTEVRDWSKDSTTVVGYKVTHMITVTSKDTSKAGAIIDAASSAGANQVYGVSFGLTDEKTAQLKKAALTEAAKNAMEKANAMADGLGVKVLRVQKIAESSSGYTPLYRDYAYAAAPMAEGAATSVEAGTVSVTADVSATFEFG